MKTNAVRLLESLGVQYELREYEVNPDDLAAETVAAKIGMPPEQVFKTLLARGDRNGLCFAVIPANTELDLKALAAATGDRKVELVPVKELLALTGYIQIWHVIALSIFQGLINAFDMPARQSFLFEMIEQREDLSNAIALNSSMVNAAHDYLSRFIGRLPLRAKPLLRPAR